jgi:thiamine-phosphate diphosphorylase
VSVPRGIWCVLDGLEPARIPQRIAAASAAGAAALTLRRPAGADGPVAAAFGAADARALWRATHGRADLALAAEAQAVIAGVRSLTVAIYRAHFGELTIGASVHDAAEAHRAREEGADFLLFGPVWDTPAKTGVLEPRGLPALAELAAGPLPVIAIGGVDRVSRVRAALSAGAWGCAVLRAGADPAQLAALCVAAAPQGRGGQSKG